jgi:hypothetical protein
LVEQIDAVERPSIHDLRQESRTIQAQLDAVVCCRNGRYTPPTASVHVGGVTRSVASMTMDFLTR